MMIMIMRFLLRHMMILKLSHRLLVNFQKFDCFFQRHCYFISQILIIDLFQ